MGSSAGWSRGNPSSSCIEIRPTCMFSLITVLSPLSRTPHVIPEPAVSMKTTGMMKWVQSMLSWSNTCPVWFVNYRSLVESVTGMQNYLSCEHVVCYAIAMHSNALISMLAVLASTSAKYTAAYNTITKQKIAP